MKMNEYLANTTGKRFKENSVPHGDNDHPDKPISPSREEEEPQETSMTVPDEHNKAAERHLVAVLSGDIHHNTQETRNTNQMIADQLEAMLSGSDEPNMPSRILEDLRSPSSQAQVGETGPLGGTAIKNASQVVDFKRDEQAADGDQSLSKSATKARRPAPAISN